ncbi:hypothetical protein SRABI27_02543 [Pedobacter sp. Bi27]|uniref:DUF1801 domain-containing protein n=1 Tax=unclassified Pedobacter TaxID=2628915 RepID=UPI001DDC71E0|nr:MULTISPECIES: DUF1801 domain-containing protein [unclassified Pedobacter]CAH0233685.1 hypothetical protein SRABI27_02543 [Pedobacter sp. Bi27]CAH0246999.1 hypothetical protein SRABI36_03115 [Pedobacter sp. Bi36]CAH0272294.1 hypothetical protein SRABI126_03515 [Pedobacter sp. Bi126]
MAKNKTTENDLSVPDFLNTIPDENKRADCFNLSDILSLITGFEAKMWGNAIVGFGSYHYKYESGREGDAPLVGFSPRKDAIALYLSSQFKDREELLAKFGKHKTAKACIYLKKMSDIDVAVLKEMTINSVERIKSLYP